MIDSGTVYLVMLESPLFIIDINEYPFDLFDVHRPSKNIHEKYMPS